MAWGLVFAILACFIWGTIFVIPEFLSDFSSLEVALGRYVAYGFFSFLLFFRKKGFSFKKYPGAVWKQAFLFALFCNLLYYPPLVLAVRYATAPVAVLVAGLTPIVVTVYGNMKLKECKFRSLIAPSFWILLGIILVNASEVDWSFSSSTPLKYLLGLGGALCALCSWSYYAVENSRFLKNHPDLPRTDWSTMIGIATLACAGFAILLLGFIKGSGIDLHKFSTLSNEASLRFFLGIAFLGIVCSWIGSFLWNKASGHLPVSITGPLIIFETIFGLLFVFLVEGRMPSLIELLGALFMFGGIMHVLFLFRKTAHA